jgi:hypothetical protein
MLYTAGSDIVCFSCQSYGCAKRRRRCIHDEQGEMSLRGQAKQQLTYKMNGVPQRDIRVISTPNLDPTKPPIDIPIVSVGAMLVGSIGHTRPEGTVIQKAEELGYFAYGGTRCPVPVTLAISRTDILLQQAQLSLCSSQAVSSNLTRWVPLDTPLLEGPHS